MRTKNIKLYAVGIGSASSGSEFSDILELPTGLMYTDPTAESYKALGMYSNVGRLFFAKATRDSLAKRGKEDINAMLKIYKPLLPDDKSLTTQQGGTLGFKGSELVFKHFDKGSGAHAELEDVLAAF